MSKKNDIRGEDIQISVCAKEECVAGKNVDFYAKDERHYYAVHYISYGNGALSCDGKEQLLTPGDIFVIPPNKDVSYRTIDRWEYFWINVEGKQIQSLLKGIGITSDNLVVSYRRDPNVIVHFTKLIETYYKFGDLDLRCKGYFYLIMGCFYDAMHSVNAPEEKKNAAFYIKEAITYLQYNYYYSSVTLDSLAKNLCVNKNYLCTIFKRDYGISPIQYLIDLRIKAACKRLVQTDEPISRVAQIVGYKDPLYFSKEFKKHIGVTPSIYRDSSTSKTVDLI